MIFILIIIILIGAAAIGFIMMMGRDNVLAEAISMYDNNIYDKALDLFKNYIVTNPKDVRAREYMAKIHFRNKDYLSALKECISITINKYATVREKAEAFALMAEMYIEQDMIEKAVKVAIEGIKLEPKNPSLHFQLGRLYIKTEKTDKAMKEFNLVLTIDRTHLPARLLLADIHLKSRDETRAIFQFRRILEIEPNNRDAAFALAKIYFDKQDFVSSFKELQSISNDTGIEIEYNYMLSVYYLKAKDKKNAKESIEKIAFMNEHKNEKITALRYELALIYEEEGTLEKAYDMYQKIKLDIPRYKDVDQRIQRIKKVLYPDEHAKLVESVDYNSLSNIEFEELLGKLTSKLGYKEMKIISKSRNAVLIIAIEKFKTALQGKYLIQLTRSFDKTGDIEVTKFIERMKDEGTDKGIFISTSTFSESALKIVELSDNIEILDKTSIYELLA